MTTNTRKTPIAVLGAVAAVLAVLAIAVLPRLMTGMAPPSSEVRIGGPFTLVDHTGRTVTDADFHGKLLLVYFGYTFCPDVCPTSLGVLAQAYDKLSPQEQAQVVPLFITVDPERDTVEQMAQYVGNFSPALIGLTGSPEQIQPVLREYKVYAKKAEGDSPNYSMDHSSILYLMGKDGKYLAHFIHDASAQDIADGVRKHL